eukprot:scaffold2223_cov46-Cyclotella_meneghiniana.AAC.4
MLDGNIAASMGASIGVLNIGALILSGWEAYKARKHADDLSESKGIGIAMYSWCQLTLVGVPVLLLIDQDDVTTRYFVKTGLVFLICTNKKEWDLSGGGRQSRLRVSGLNTMNMSGTHHLATNVSRTLSMGSNVNYNTQSRRLSNDSTLGSITENHVGQYKRVDLNAWSEWRFILKVRMILSWVMCAQGLVQLSEPL